MDKRRFLIAVFAFLFLSVASVSSQNLRILNNYITGLNSPVFLTNAGDGTGRLFIVEQGGTIKVVKRGARTATDFLNLASVISTGGERGLLGLAFHPQYESNRRFFVYYTRSDGDIQIAEYEASAADPNVANPNAVRIIITIEHSQNSNHNGGTIAFGPDGYLYAGPGDGGSANDPPNNAQNINSLLGKMLRLDINTPVGQVPAYNIPPTNPYAGATAGADEIYAIGLRNPYRFSFDRGGTNQLWLGDVGQNAIEEVDIVTLGGNYGWRVFEGTRCTQLDPALCNNPQSYTPPVFEYFSGSPDPRCSITGGHVYRGPQRALPPGSYIYGDYCTGEVFLWHNNQQLLLADTTRNITSFGEDEAGELYIVGHGGTIDKILGNKPASADFDGDLGTDLAVFRPSNAIWYFLNPLTGAMNSRQFGANGDIPAPEDFDGDGKTDLAVFRPSEGRWYLLTSSNQAYFVVQFGLNGDIPVAADYDGDSLADIVVFRPSTGEWHVLPTDGAPYITVKWGVPGDIPVAGDFDGDGTVDLVVWRPSDANWWVLTGFSQIYSVISFGVNGDIPVAGDFDGDGRNDHAIYRPSTNQWFIRELGGGSPVVTWGTAGDIPAVGDYDADGRDDIAVFRPSTGTWWVIRSSQGMAQFPGWGIEGDLPIPKYDNP